MVHITASAILALAATTIGLAKPINQPYHCPKGLDCGPGPVCTVATCRLPGCAGSPVCADIQTRQVHCPDGLDCGHEPVCTTATCGLPGCADLPICIAINEKRTPKFGPGPVCTPYTCGLPGCKGLPMCAVKSNKLTATTVNNATNTTIPGKLPSVECTSASCHLPGCAEAAICACTIEDCAQPACAVTEVCKGIGNTEQKVGRAFPVSGKLPQVECTPATCGLPGCKDLPMCAAKSEIPVATADENATTSSIPGKLPPVECTILTCYLSGCAEAPVCKCSIEDCRPMKFGCIGADVCKDIVNNVQKIGEPSPLPGKLPRIECTAATCGLPGCAGAEVCTLPGKLPKVQCTSASCHLPGCASSDVCTKHTPPTETPVSFDHGNHTIHHPCPDICDQDGNCGCNYEAVHGKVKRVAVGDIIHPCPLICNAEGKCGCNYADKEKRVAGQNDKRKFCPMICDEDGNCGCNYGVGDETPPA